MAEKYQQIITNCNMYGSISYAFSLAKESGLLKTLLQADEALTSEEIAIRSEIRERYARELLGCLSAVELLTVTVTPDQDGVSVCRYHLDPEAKQVLNTGPNIPFMNFVKVIGSRYDEVRVCLNPDKPAGLRYSQSFFDGTEELKIQRAPATVECLLKNVQGLKQRLERGIEVIEFGCGMAHIISQLAAMFPASTFTATEVSPQVLNKPKKNFSHLPNLKWDIVDMCAIPEKMERKYDWLLANDVTHDLPHPLEALKGVRRMARDDESIFTCVDLAGTGSHLEDVGNLQAAFLYANSTFICIPESFQSEDSEAHGASWGKKTFLDFASSAGFETDVFPIEGVNVLFICKPV